MSPKCLVVQSSRQPIDFRLRKLFCNLIDMGSKCDTLLPYIQFLVRSIHHSRFTLHAPFEVFNPVPGMEVGAEMGVDFHFF